MKKTPKRPQIESRSVLLRSFSQIEFAQKLVSNLPIDPDQPIEVLIREQVKKRKLSLNAAMWAGPLRDIERTGWCKGRQYCAEVWHEHFKEGFLPDENDPEFDPSHVLDGYKKWDIDPWKGTRVLVGSTTQLTDKGMKFYLLQMEAEATQEYGAILTPRTEDLDPQWRQSA